MDGAASTQTMDDPGTATPVAPPHWLSLGFDWGSGGGALDEARRDAAVLMLPVVRRRGPTRRTLDTASAGRRPRDCIHTSLRFARPVDHPLAMRKRQWWQQQYHQHPLPFLEGCQPLRVALSDAWSSESACVSSLGADGSEASSQPNESQDRSERVDNGRVVPDGLHLSARGWVVQVDSLLRTAGDTPWFRLATKDGKGSVWLEGDEIFVFLQSLRSQAIGSVCIHLQEDDVTAVVPLPEAEEFFRALIAAPMAEATCLERSSTITNELFLMQHLLKFGRGRQCEPRGGSPANDE